MESKNALIKLKKRERNDAIFDVFVIVNAQGFNQAENPKNIYGNDGTIIVKDFFNNREYEEMFEIINNKELVETTISIIDSKPFLPYKECKLDVIKRVKHLYNTCWISTKDNQFYEPGKKVLNYLRNNKSVIPFDLNSKKMYEPITLIDGVIYPFNPESSEIKSSDITEDERFIPLSNSKDEYCMTEKAFRKLNKTESSPVDLMRKEDLKKWLRNLLIQSQNDEKVIDTLINKLNANSNIEDEVVQERLKRCKNIFKETILSKEALQYFLNQPNWKKALEKEKQEMLISAREEAEKEVILEKEKKKAQIDDEMRLYKDAVISDIIAKQEAQLEDLQSKIAEKEQLLSSFNDSIDAKKIELDKVNSEIQTKTVSLVTLTDNKIKVIEELEEKKSSFVNLLKNGLFQASNTVVNKEPCNLFEDFFPIEPTSDDSDEEDDDYKIINTKWNVDKKRDVVSILTSIASMIPNVSYAYTLAHFAGNCHVKVITVEHGWYHFEDFRKAGLVDFWNKALITPEENYLLVLQNINMIPIQSALQPLVDVINENRISIPGATKNEYPMNLRVVGTILPTEGENAPGLPLDEKSYSRFLFIGAPEDSLPLSLPKILSIKPERHKKFSDVKIDEKRGIDTDGFEKYSAY